jgi:hypothetical protein
MGHINEIQKSPLLLVFHVFFEFFAFTLLLALTNSCSEILLEKQMVLQVLTEFPIFLAV